MPDHLDLLDSPPAAVASGISRLRTGFQADGIPKKKDDHVLIGTWNIREFGGLTPKWETDDDDSPKRNLADVCYIAEIASHFDVVAIQETGRKLAALRAVMKRLGPHWSFLMSDVTEGEKGDSERLAYVFDTRRVQLSGLAGEIVIPEEDLQVDTAVLDRQFAKTPYAVSFKSGPEAFTLVTLHIYYGDRAEDRRPELLKIAEWLAERATDDDDFNHNLIALGDFNTDRLNDANFNAFISTGLSPPSELLEKPRTITGRGGKAKFYDQIAWFTQGSRSTLTLKYTGQAGNFEWTKYILASLTARSSRSESLITTRSGQSSRSEGKQVS